MASSKVYYDTRNRKGEGLLFVIVRHKGGMFTIPLNIHLNADEWDAGREEVMRKNTQYRRYNNHIRSILSKIETIILDLTEKGQIEGLSAKQLKQIALMRLNQPSDADPITFQDFAASTIEKIATEGTRSIYNQTLRKLNTYTNGRKLYFADITVDWLENFDAWMVKNEMAINGRSVHLRNIRALFNKAISKDITDQNSFPFRRFKIKKETTRKRSLTVEQLRALRDYRCEEHQAKWRDMFMLIFYLIGINTVDLMALTEIQNGRVEYRRAKTHRLYSVKVEPEALALIEKYRGEAHLLNFGDTYRNHRDFCHRLNQNIQEIGTFEWIENKSVTNPKKNKKKRHPIFPELTTYWARHTWATIAAQLDIPKETIAAALGHELGNSTTAIYINFDQRKIDEANRQVIDWVNKA